MSLKDLQNQRVVVPTLEYHDKNWTWTDMLMELKKDYRSAIVQQTIKSAIGMKGPDEVAGLVSPKSKRSESKVTTALVCTVYRVFADNTIRGVFCSSL